jgi:hypothetical protein
MNLPKLTKEEIKKAILSVLGLIALLYCYSAFLLGPLNQARARMISAAADGEQKLADGKKTIEQAAHLEVTARNSKERMKAIDELTPAGAPVAWFPPLIKTFFATDQIEIGHARLSNTTDFKQLDLAAYSKTDWIIDIPRADFLLLGLSISRLENERPSAKITNIRIQAIQDKPEFQSVTLGVAMIVKK